MRGQAVLLLVLSSAASLVAARTIGHPPTRDKGPVGIHNPIAGRSPLHRFTHDHGPSARVRAVVPDRRQGRAGADHPETREKGPAA